ncbi:transcriptional repressor [bacterium]|nr:transcriptional repressor [bacterium]
MSTEDILKNIRGFIKGKGYFLTGPRYDVAKILVETPTHMDADEVHQLLGKARVDASTVYRVLNLFCKLRITRKIVIDNGPAQFELSERFLRHHHHLICKHCGKVVNFDEYDFLESDLSKLERLFRRKYHFIVADHKIEFEGICAKCEEPRRKG